MQITSGMRIGIGRPRDIFRELRSQSTIALSSTIGSLYTASPIPIASRGSNVTSLAQFTSAERIYRYSLYSVVALGNALQSWTLEVHGEARRKRQLGSVAAHGSLGIAGGALIIAMGPWLTETLFGTQLAASRSVMVGFAVAFACTSTSTPCIRNILLPSGAKRRVLAGTIAGACFGVPMMALGAMNCGVAMVSLGLGLSEFIALLITGTGAIRCIKRRTASIGA